MTKRENGPRIAFHAQVIEVDAPGLTTPALSRHDWQHMPRPVLPIDPAVTWNPA